MASFELHGKPAVRVNAEAITWANTSKAQQYLIDGCVKMWVPKSVSQFTPTKEHEDQKKTGRLKGDTPGTLIIEEWFYKNFFKGETQSK